MKVTQADMDSRKRMIDLRSSLTDVILQHKVTNAELLTVLAEMMAAWARYLRQAELIEKDEAEGDR